MEDLNGIIRVEKTTKNFVIINKIFLNDNRLSFKAKGIMTYLLSKPDDWKVMVHELIEASSDGKTAVRSALKELEQYGYYKKYPVRTEDGKRIDHWESVVYESPQTAEPEKTKAPTEKPRKAGQKSVSLFPDFQKVDKQKIDNEPLLSNYLLNNDFTKSTTTSSSSFKDNNKTARGRARTKTTSGKAGKIADRTIAIRNAISYGRFVASGADMELVDQIIAYVAGYQSHPTDLRVDNELVPKRQAVELFKLLDHDTVASVIDKYQAIRLDSDVKNERLYILAMLYDSIMAPSF